MTEALKPCPMCGSGDVRLEAAITEATVRCRCCGLRISREDGRPADLGVAQAIAAWNTRPAESVPEEVVEMYRAYDAILCLSKIGQIERGVAISRRQQIRETIRAIYGPEGVKQLEGE